MTLPPSRSANTQTNEATPHLPRVGEVVLAEYLQHGLAVRVPQVGHALVQVLRQRGNVRLDGADAPELLNHAKAVL